jgi:hypothetical protein
MLPRDIDGRPGTNGGTPRRLIDVPSERFTATDNTEGESGVTNDRKSIQAAAQAALWTISNGKCYAPGCPFPVIVEVRPGVYKKNAQIAHIHGVKAPRFRPGMSVEERDSFKNLILLCLPHHAEVDDKKYGERLYPPEKLREWKTKHEGEHAATLRMIGPIDVDTFMDRLADVFEPPTRRLEALAEQLEKTGTLNANSVAELRVIITALRDNPLGPDPRTVGQLMDAVTMLGGRDFPRTVAQLMDAATIMNNANRYRSQFE